MTGAGSNHPYVHRAKFWCEHVKLEPNMELMTLEPSESNSLVWEAPQWLKVGNVFFHMSFILWKIYHFPWKLLHAQTCLGADLHVLAPTHKGTSDASIFVVFYNPQQLFFPFVSKNFRMICQYKPSRLPSWSYWLLEALVSILTPFLLKMAF